MTDYFVAAATSWLVGFVPMLEIYIAVPVAVAMGLDYVSAVFWPSFGNFVPILLIALAFEQIRRIPRIGAWIERRASTRFQGMVNKHGAWFIVLVTPLIGSWAVAVTGVLLGIDRRQLIVFSAISILLYAIVIVALLAIGFDIGGQSELVPDSQ